MLVLTRRADEIILVGKNQEIKIQVVAIEGGQVRIGIDADRSIPVVRKEIANY
jgi:carbon storage regulator